jgi:hypothetical protein
VKEVVIGKVGDGHLLWKPSVFHGMTKIVVEAGTVLSKVAAGIIDV